MFGEYVAVCRELELNAAQDIAAVASNMLVDAPQTIRKNPRDAVFWALQAAYTMASDVSASPIDRRQCFTALTTMLERIDKAKGQPSRQQSSIPAETRPAAESLSPEHHAVMAARENSDAFSGDAVADTATARSHPSFENNLPQKRPAAEVREPADSARTNPALNGNARSYPQGTSSPFPLVTSPLRRAASPTPPPPPLPPPKRAPPPATRPNGQVEARSGASESRLPSLKAPPGAPAGSQDKQRGVPPASSASTASKPAASDSAANHPPEEASRHAFGNAEPTARRREVSAADSADGKKPGSLPNGQLKPPPPGLQSSVPASSTAPLLVSTELRNARDPPKASRPAAQNARPSASNDVSAATSGAAAQQEASTGAIDRPSASRSRSLSPERPAALSVPRKAAASSTAVTAGVSGNARTGVVLSGNVRSQSLTGTSRPAEESPAAVAMKPPPAAQKEGNGVRNPAAESTAAAVPKADRPGQESSDRQSKVAAGASRSDGGRDRDAVIPRREREQSFSTAQRREQSTLNSASRSGASSHAKPDLMYLCLQRYGSNETVERKSFVAQPDTNRFSGALEERDRVTLEFEQTTVNMTEALAMMDRLQRWDPFWEFAGPVMIGKLGRILVPALETPPPEGTALNEAYKAKAVKLAKDGKLLRTAMKLVFTPNTDLKPHDERDVFKLIPFPSWHNPQRTTFENGEAHLILRMLPCNPPTQGKLSVSSYRSRVDCHIWPKGTFLQHNGNPAKLRQRKLDKGNRTWKHSDPKELHPLDLTLRIQDPRTEQVLELCCYDDEPFLYCLSICRYRSHAALYRSLTLENSPERLETVPYDAGLARIIELAKPVLLDGVEEASPGGDNFAYYSLLCPLTRKTMSHPVRGRKCSHFQVRTFGLIWSCAQRAIFLTCFCSIVQCFDLMSFLEINTPPTAARWRCGVMDCNRFLSVRDLVFCQLTSETLREEESRIEPDRHRMRFDTSGRYRLIREEDMPQPPSRRQVVVSSSSSSSQPPPGRKSAAASETVDLALL